jgi:hypothetical protein
MLILATAARSILRITVRRNVGPSHHGLDEQMFGTKYQVSRSGQIDQEQRGTVVLTGRI